MNYLTKYVLRMRINKYWLPVRFFIGYWIRGKKYRAECKRWEKYPDLMGS